MFDGSGFVGYHEGTGIGRTEADSPRTGESDRYVGKDTVGNSIRATNDGGRLYDRALPSREITELATMDEG